MMDRAMVNVVSSRDGTLRLDRTRVRSRCCDGVDRGGTPAPSKEPREFWVDLLGDTEPELATRVSVCVHALPSLLQYAMAMRAGATPAQLRLAKGGRVARIRPRTTATGIFAAYGKPHRRDVLGALSSSDRDDQGIRYDGINLFYGDGGMPVGRFGMDL